MTKAENQLFAQYMINNPGAQNPIQYFNALGEDGIIQVIRKANGEEVVFMLVIDEEGVPVFDLIVPTVRGEILEGYEPGFDGFTLEEA